MAWRGGGGRTHTCQVRAARRGHKNGGEGDTRSRRAAAQQGTQTTEGAPHTGVHAHAGSRTRRPARSPRQTRRRHRAQPIRRLRKASQHAGGRGAQQRTATPSRLGEQRRHRCRVRRLCANAKPTRAWHAGDGYPYRCEPARAARRVEWHLPQCLCVHKCVRERESERERERATERHKRGRFVCAIVARARYAARARNRETTKTKRAEPTCASASARQPVVAPVAPNPAVT